MSVRGDELAWGLRHVRDRIAAACAAVSRDPDGVTLIAITKTFPASDIRLLADLGVTDIGENREQEARAKHDECVDLPLRWHFVGQLQRNKARSVASYADVVHSVDRLSLVTALSAAAEASHRRITALVQVSLDVPPDPGRGGAPPDLAGELADVVAAAPGLHLGGVMGVAPLDDEPASAFARLARVAQRVQVDHPTATVISAGMSSDLEAAIGHGATHVRIGTALLGHRPSPVG